jgi:hypothetical protein
LIRPAFWSALLPRFPWCLGAIVPKLFPSSRPSPPTPFRDEGSHLSDRVSGRERRYTCRMHIHAGASRRALSGAGCFGARPFASRVRGDCPASVSRERKITTAQLRRLLGFSTRYELDGFLREHQVWLDYTARDLEQDLQLTGGSICEPSWRLGLSFPIPPAQLSDPD